MTVRSSPVAILMSVLLLAWPSHAARAGVDVVFTSANSDGESVCAERIIAEMRKAKKSILIAVAHFNYDIIADALLDIQKKRGKKLDIRVIVDLGEFSAKVSQAKRLEKGGVSLRYKTYSLSFFWPHSRLMHHKIMLVDDKMMLTGSYNWSATAEHLNYENIMVFKGKEHAGLVRETNQEFERLWGLNRGVYDDFMSALTSKKGSKGYRRYFPVHFGWVPMTLNRKESQRIRSAAYRFGYRAYQHRDALWFDKEKKKPHTKPVEEIFVHATGVVITEIDRSFVELYNQGRRQVDLRGWVVQTSAGLFELTGKKAVLRPGAVALLVKPRARRKAPEGGLVLKVKGLFDEGLESGKLVLVAGDGESISDACPKLQPFAAKRSWSRKDVDRLGVEENWRSGSPTPGSVKLR